MSESPETPEERIARIRAWARPPYRVVDVASTEDAGSETLNSGIANPSVEAPANVDTTEGGGTVFHNAGDAPAGTTVSRGAGGVLGWAEILPVFWGAAWTNPALSPGVGNVMAAVAAVGQIPTTFGTYSYFDGLNQYSGGDFITWGFDIAAPPLVVSTNPPNNPFSLNDVANEAQALYNTPDLGPGGVDNVYWSLMMVFMPPGWNPSGPFGEHTYFTDNAGAQIDYAYVSYGTLGQITQTFFHELVEALTDPHGDAWQVNPRNANSWNEICDACATTTVWNGTTVPSYFSAKDGGCLVPSAPPPPLPAGDYQIDQVLKVQNRWISEVSGPGTPAAPGRWVLPEYEVVSMIEQGLATFYTDVDGRRAEVGVERWYLKTVPDDFGPNNLDNLPSI